MNFRIDSNFISNGLHQLENLFSPRPANQPQPQQTAPTQSLTQVARTIGQALPDLGASLLRSQLQIATKPTAPAATKSSIAPFNFGSALSFFGKIASGVAGSFVSSIANAVVSKIPSSLVQGGIQLASKYFGGQGGNGIESDVASHLREFGLSSTAVSAAKVYSNSPNAIPGYATTLGTDIHFGDTIDPKYWVAADNLQRLINSNASPEAIHDAQNKLRATINDFGLLAHETTHVSQYKAAGSTGFAAKYASDFAGGFVNRVLDQALSGNFDTKKIFDLNDNNAPFGGAYRGVGYEQEAYKFGNGVEAQLESRYASLLNYSNTPDQIARDRATVAAKSVKCNCGQC